jgi:hypothetical protein
MLSLLLVSTCAAAENSTTSLITDFYLRATSNAVHSHDLFEWPMTTDIDAVVKLDAPAASNAQVLIVISSAGEVLGKYKAKQAVAAGRQELRIPKVFATDKVLGQRLLTAQLQLAVKGYALETREITFEIKGPPQPKVSIDTLRIYTVNQSDTPVSINSVKQFAVGQPFMVEAVITVADNPAHLHPRLTVLASMT